MKAIVCADINWGIGKGAGMLFHIPADLKFFKERQWAAPLSWVARHFSPCRGEGSAGQEEYSADARQKLSAENVTVCHGIDELTDIIENGENVFLMGGEAVYNELIDSCDEAYVTRVNADGKAEKFFPDLDRRAGWRLVERSAAQESNGYVFTFDRYVKK